MIDLIRTKQIIVYGWEHAGQMARKKEKGFGEKSRIFFDIIRCYHKYKMWSNQYLKENFYYLSEEERKAKGSEYRKIGKQRDNWQKQFRQNNKFLVKYKSLKYEKPELRSKRNAAYQKQYSTGDGLLVRYDVHIGRQHYKDGTIKIGENVTIVSHSYIDYTGELIIGNNVGISEGVIIHTHEHPGYVNPAYDIHYVKATKVEIEDGVIIGDRAIINASVGRIGRNARIGTGAVVRQSVPPYAIVMGNPAKIVGFSMTPEQVEEYERNNYLENDRISMEEFTREYNKLFLDKIEEIKQFLKKSC